MKGRDLLIGAIAGGILIILLTHAGSKPQSGHSPSASATQTSSSGKHHHHHNSGHGKTAGDQHTHPATTKPPHTAGASPAASATTQTSGQASPHPTTSAHAASPAAKSSGLGNGLIAVACLIAIAAALFTVTMTVRGLRANK